MVVRSENLLSHPPPNLFGYGRLQLPMTNVAVLCAGPKRVKKFSITAAALQLNKIMLHFPHFCFPKRDTQSRFGSAKCMITDS
jgi:hypothetical protein